MVDLVSLEVYGPARCNKAVLNAVRNKDRSIMVVSTPWRNISQTWESSPSRGENEKSLKPPPRAKWGRVVVFHHHKLTHRFGDRFFHGSWWSWTEIHLSGGSIHRSKHIVNSESPVQHCNISDIETIWRHIFTRPFSGTVITYPLIN